MSWKIVHKYHDEIAIGEVFPGNLEWALYLNKPGYAQYSCDFTSSLCNRNNTRAYVTDYILSYNSTDIMGGYHTSISIDDVENHEIQVAGVEWLQYLDTLLWPFDPADPLLYTYQATGRDLALIVQDLLDISLSQSDTMDFTYNLNVVNQTTDYKIEPADSESMLSKISTLSQIDPGFDFGVTVDKEIVLLPTIGSQSEFLFSHGNNCKITDYQDAGPLATSIIATAQSNSSKMSAVRDGSEISLYRRKTASIDFNTVSTQAQLDAHADAEIIKQSTPQEQFSVMWVLGTDEIIGNVNIGDTVPVEGDLGYVVIDGNYRIVSMTCKQDDNGTDEITIGFDDGSLSL